MTAFHYKVRDRDGSPLTGLIDAASLDEAGKQLRAAGKLIVSIEPAKREAAPAKHVDEAAAPVSGSIRGKVPRTEVIAFTHQLGIMIETGVPIADALACAVEQTESDNFRLVLEDVTARVEAGGDFSRALQAHPRVFPPVVTSLVSAAEASGTLGAMLRRIGEYLNKEQTIVRKVRGAVSYPLVMMGFSVVVTCFLLAFVLPRFATIYADRGATLPTPTRILMGISTVMTEQYPWIIAGVLGVALALWQACRTDSGKLAIDRLKLGLPLVGPLFRKLYITRSCRTMGTMIEAGVPVLDMVAIVRNVTPNRLFEKLWADVEDRLHSGAQLSAAMSDSPLIPRNVSQMVIAGERSGRLGEVMGQIAKFSEDDFDEQVKTVTQYIEPAMVVFMGALVGFVTIALLVPIFNVGKVVSGG